jgi:hypothetical protein
MLAGLIPRRLGPEATVPLPSDLLETVRLALHWQATGPYARLWEAAGAEQNRMYELAGCKAAIGEQIGLSCAAERDYRGWLEVRLEGDEAVEAEMAKRALAELACYYILGAGHTLFNFAARTVRLDPALKDALIHEFHTDFPPLSEQRDAWLSATIGRAKKLQTIAQSSLIPEIQVVGDPTVSFVGSDEWDHLNEARGSDFHRWRVQTDGILGVAKKSPWRQGDGVRSMDLGFGDVLGKDAQAKLASETMRIAASARTELMKAARAFDPIFVRATAATTGLDLSK